LIDPERTIQLGLRGRSFHFWSYSFDVGTRVVTAEEFQEKGAMAMAEEARKIVGDGPCYLTFDVDVLDPMHMPGTGLPEPFGLTTREVSDFIRGLRGLDLVGADIAELCPPADPTEMSANIVAGFCFEMLCLLSEAHVARTGVSRKTHWNNQ
jgi:arginase family enzyme